MKRNRLLSLLTLSLVSLIILQSNSGGYQAIVAHAPTSPTGGCNCHGPATQSQNNNLKIEVLDAANNLVTNYAASTNYKIRVSLTKFNVNTSAGFQVGIFNTGTTTQAGTPIAGNLTRVDNIGGTRVVNHSQKDVSSIKTGSDVVWEFNWDSPIASFNNLTVYAIANDANNDGATTGDFISYNTYPLNKISVGVEDFSKGIDAIYPNPTSGPLVVKLESGAESQISIFSITGQLVKTMNANSNTVNLDVSELTKGNYIITIAQNGNFARQQFVKY